MATIPMTRKEWTINRLEAWTHTKDGMRRSLVDGLASGLDARTLGTAWTDFVTATAQCRVLEAALNAFDTGEDPVGAMMNAVTYCGDPRVGSLAASDLIRQWDGCHP